MLSQEALNWNILDACKLESESFLVKVVGARPTKTCDAVSR